MTIKTDVLVIGAGPGGYPAAIRAAQLNKKVILIEKGFIGGECLNWGCIPSKALISASNFYHKLITESAVMGINIEKATVDVETLQKWKSSVQEKLISGIKQLLKGNKVELILGTANFLDTNRIRVQTENNEEIRIEATNIILATGANFISLPEFEIDEKDILSAKGALNLNEIPEELVCIGGGVIGLELGTVYAKLGSKVKFIELLPEILPDVDPSLTRVVKNRLKTMGVEFYTNSQVKKYKKMKNGKLKLEIETKQGLMNISTNKILVAIGKRASTKELQIDRINLKTDEKGFIKVNQKQQTNISSIFAVGDCTGIPFLAHRATKQGIVAAEVIAGLPAESDFKAIPSAIFTDPEIAYVGLTEKEAKAAGYDVITGRSTFAASGRALTHIASHGFVKIIADAKTGLLLGAQIVGPEASDLISEIVLALEMSSTLEDLALSVHPHPTLPEMIMEAAEAALGKAIHQINPLSRKK